MGRRLSLMLATAVLATLLQSGGAAAFSIADLGVAVKASPSPVALGGALTYTLTVSNAGPNVAVAKVGDVVPLGLTANSISQSQGSCSGLGTGTVSCELGSLAMGATATVVIVVRPSAQGTLTNTASVGAADGLDLVVFNNLVQTVTEVGPPSTGAGPPNPSPPPPTVSGFTLSKRRFHVGQAPTAIRASVFPSAFRFTLSESATVSILLEQRLGNGRSRARGTLTRLLGAGANSVPFSGRYGSKALRRGSWQATITAVDLAGAASAPRKVVFRIL